MIEDAPALFLFGGVEYRGTASGINRRRPLETFGFDDQPELTIAINIRDRYGAAVFGQDRPGIGSRITYQGTVYRVERTEIDCFDECLQMDLRSKDK